MKEFLALYPQLLLRPMAAIRRVAANPQNILAFVFFLLITIVGTWVDKTRLPAADNLAAKLHIADARIVSVLLAIGVGLLTVFFATLMAHVISRRMHGQGTFRMLWTAMLLIVTTGAVFSFLPIPYNLYLGLNTAWTFIMVNIAVMIIYGFRFPKALGIATLSLLATAAILSVVIGLSSFGIGIATAIP